MSIRFACPHCRKRLKADDADAGRRALCTGCGKVVDVPTAAPAARSSVPVAPLVLRTEPSQDDEIDMTPMIDVVFQLLIFFMVTATYALQKALPMPTPDAAQAAALQQTADTPSEDDLLVVRVDADDAVWVDDVLTVSRHDLIAKLRDKRTAHGPGGEPGPRRMLVSADPDAHHDAVVLALDAGSAAGMEEVRLTTADETE
jgi:biopolymer transport protein ExbD